MNILIVDDELPALLAIKYMVDWPRLEVENVYTAADVPGAKRVFERQPIDFLLCDIEMPGVAVLGAGKSSRYHQGSFDESRGIFLCPAGYGPGKHRLSFKAHRTGTAGKACSARRRSLPGTAAGKRIGAYGGVLGNEQKKAFGGVLARSDLR